MSSHVSTLRLFLGVGSRDEACGAVWSFNCQEGLQESMQGPRILNWGALSSEGVDKWMDRQSSRLRFYKLGFFGLAVLSKERQVHH